MSGRKWEHVADAIQAALDTDAERFVAELGRQVVIERTKGVAYGAATSAAVAALGILVTGRIGWDLVVALALLAVCARLWVILVRMVKL